MSKQVNKRELAEILNVSERTLTDWQKQGMPHQVATAKGHANTYITGDVIGWLNERNTGSDDVDLNHERALLARAQREKTQLEVDRLKGLSIDADVVEKVWTGMMMNARQKILGLPSKITPQIFGADQPTINSTLTRELHEALRELSEYDPEQYASKSK